MSAPFFFAVSTLAFINCGASAVHRDWWSAGCLLLIGLGCLHLGYDAAVTKATKATGASQHE